MALTLGDIAVYARITTDPADPVPTPYSSILDRLQRSADVQINNWAADAPETVREWATLAVVGYAFDRPLAFRRMAFSDVFTNCGARATLSAWHTPVSVRVE